MSFALGMCFSPSSPKFPLLLTKRGFICCTAFQERILWLVRLFSTMEVNANSLERVQECRLRFFGLRLFLTVPVLGI